MVPTQDQRSYDFFQMFCAQFREVYCFQAKNFLFTVQFYAGSYREEISDQIPTFFKLMLKIWGCVAEPQEH